MTKVSVIIPIYNKGDFLKECIQSVLNQTFKDIEIVCIDDASTDNSYSVLKQLSENNKQIITYQNIENKGVVYTRNYAIEMSSGEYILPLDADDKIEPTYIEKAVKILNENPDIGIVYCKADYIGLKNEKWDLPDFDKEKILFENCIFCSALFRKSDFYNAGKYKERMNQGWEDYDLWLSIIENGLYAYRIPEILFHYRKTEQETRSDKTNAKKIKIYKDLIKNHLDLYLNSDEFINRIFSPWENKESKKKYKKYKNLFKISLILIILLFAILIIAIAV